MALKNVKEITQKRAQGASQFAELTAAVTDEFKRLEPDATVSSLESERLHQAVPGASPPRFLDGQLFGTYVLRRGTVLHLTHLTWISLDEGSCEYVFKLEVGGMGRVPALTLFFHSRDALDGCPTWRLSASKGDHTDPLSLMGLAARLLMLPDLQSGDAGFLLQALGDRAVEVLYPEIGPSRWLPRGAVDALPMARAIVAAFVEASNG